LARHNALEYVRGKPKVLDNIRAAVTTSRAAPKHIYAAMAANPESMPRNLAQVRNMSRSVKADRQEAVKGNFADEMLRIAGGVQTHPFVQLVTFRAGLSPVIVAYTDEQLTSMKRFCCRSTPARYRSVLGVDRTFNLGPCFVTSIVYKNASVNLQESGSPPIFIGPVMFHFDGNESTYNFFSSTSPTNLNRPLLWSTCVKTRVLDVKVTLCLAVMRSMH
jgi:hypothetical protein